MLLQVLLWLLFTTSSQQHVEHGERKLHWQRNTNFSDTTNWSRGKVPGNDDVVTLNDGYHVSLHSLFSVNKMLLTGNSVLSLHEGGSISAAIPVPSTTHETKWLEQELFDPDNWETNTSITPLDLEKIPCIGDTLVFQRPEDLSAIKPMKLNLKSIIINHSQNRSMEIHNQIRGAFFNTLYGLSIPFDNITFYNVICHPGCDLISFTARLGTKQISKICDLKTCPRLIGCTLDITPPGQCCHLCALVYTYQIPPSCRDFAYMRNLLTRNISRHVKFLPLLKTMNVSISYINPLKTQLTWSGLSDADVRVAEEIMATVVEESFCWKLIKTQSSLPKPQAPPSTSKTSRSHGVGLSIFFFFFFAILILAAYAMRHRIRNRYIPSVIERVEDVARRWRGRRVANIEMGGGIIFDNSSVFDIQNENSVGSGGETLVNNDFLQPTPTSTKSTKRPKKKSGFNNPAFQEDVKKKSGGSKKMADKEVNDKIKDKEDEKEDDSGNTFFNI